MMKIGKEFDQLQFLRRWDKKLVNFGPQTKKVLGAPIDPLKWTFSGD